MVHRLAKSFSGGALLIAACGGGAPSGMSSDIDAGREPEAAVQDAAQPLADASSVVDGSTQQDAAPDDAASSEGEAGVWSDAGRCDRSAVPVGDITCDGCVNGADHDRLLENYGASVPPGDAASDVNGDGTIDVHDRSLVLQHWGEGC